jgi:hypothetical protein
MTKEGESCFPSIDTIAEESGLVKRTVVNHIKRAREEGWINVQKRRLKGQRWKRNEYFATIPQKVMHEMHQVLEGSASDSEGGASGDAKVVHQMPSNSTVNTPRNSPLAAGEDDHTRTDSTKYLFELWWDLYDKKKAQRDCERLWRKMSDEERAAALDHTAKYVRDGQGSDRQYRRKPSAYLTDKDWNDRDMLRPRQSGPFIPSRPDNGAFEARLKAISEHELGGARS